MTSPMTPKLLEAAEHALAGDWQSAHQIVQDHDDDPMANWIHAVVHRVAGDMANARYWYARCKRVLREDVSIQAELEQIRAELRP